MQLLSNRISVVVVAATLGLAPRMTFAAGAEPASPTERATSAAAEPTESPDTSSDESADASSNEQRANTLFAQARYLLKGGEVKLACETFRRALDLTDGIGVKYNLADCYEQAGKRPRAHDLFVEVARLTKAAGQAERERAALARAEALEEKLGSLRFVFGGDDVPSIELHSNKGVISVKGSQEEVFVEPAHYEIVAQAPGRRAWKAKSTVDAGQRLTVTVPDLEREDEKETVTETKPTPDSEASVAEEEVPDDSDDDSGFDAEDEEPGLVSSLIPSAALGVGAAGLFAGVAFTEQYRASNDDAKAVCPSGFGCSAAEIERHDKLVADAKQAQTRAVFGFSVGAAGIVGGALYYYFTHRDRAKTRAGDAEFGVSPVVEGDQVGGVVHGRF